MGGGRANPVTPHPDPQVPTAMHNNELINSVNLHFYDCREFYIIKRQRLRRYIVTVKSSFV